MAAPQPPTATAPRIVRRRRRRGITVLLLGSALVLWLAGRGLGWLGSGGEQSGTAQPAAGPVSEAESPSPHQSLVRSPLNHPAPSVEAAAAESLPESLPEVPAKLPAEVAPGVPALAPVAATGEGLEHLDADRFHSLTSIVVLRLEQQDLPAAAVSLANLRQQQLADEQRDDVEALQRRLQLAVQDVGVRLQACLQRGEVLAARPLAESWFALAAGSRTLPAPLDSVFDSGLDWRQALVLDSPPPQPTPLPRQRRVRFEWRGEILVGSVAQARADQVTMRVETAQGQSHPTVRTVACEPIESSAEEAVEMALVAVAGGDALLARLWWARAALLGGSSITAPVAPAPRSSGLRSLLR